jgi:hypothetical protein
MPKDKNDKNKLKPSKIPLRELIKNSSSPKRKRAKKAQIGSLDPTKRVKQ